VKPHVFHPEAAKEYAEAARYYYQIDQKLAGRFYDELEHLIEAIRKNPSRYRHFDPPAQRHRSTVFPYAIIYVEKPDCILILAVMHLKRHPDYWKHRLK
jgi:plasmid stabilization system protein ParE